MTVSSLLLRTSTVLLLVGLTLGLVMGIRQDFAMAPAHAHLNLVGFVLMFAAGIYYRLVPAAEEGLLAKIQATLHIIGAITFPGALALMLSIGPKFEPAVVIGAMVVFAAMILFAIIVFRTTQASRSVSAAALQRA